MCDNEAKTAFGVGGGDRTVCGFGLASMPTPSDMLRNHARELRRKAELLDALADALPVKMSSVAEAAFSGILYNALAHSDSII